MLKTKNLQKGFTIVELLIVIVVIGILAALVLNTFAGVQAKARDTERKTDVDAVAKQLEVFHADNGYYPPLASWDTATEAKTTFGSIDEAALIAPQETAVSWQATTSADKADYGYVAVGCVAPDVECDSFTLSYTEEAPDPDVVVTKDSLNN